MNAPRRFEDRAEAGECLAAALLRRQPMPEPCIVLALPRGGLPVAAPVARQLGARLDVMTVRKIGLPANPECAIGAVAPGIVYRDDAILRHRGLDDSVFRHLADAAEAQRLQREQLFRAQREACDLRDATAVLVDDGLATGATMIAAVRAARAAGASRVIAAAPVASQEAVQRLAAEADDVVVLQVPPGFSSVGEWYDRFPQIEDAVALALFAKESP